MSTGEATKRGPAAGPILFARISLARSIVPFYARKLQVVKARGDAPCPSSCRMRFDAIGLDRLCFIVYVIETVFTCIVCARAFDSTGTCYHGYKGLIFPE